MGLGKGPQGFLLPASGLAEFLYFPKKEEENITGKNVIKGREKGGQGTDMKRWWPEQKDHEDRQTYNLPTHGCCLQRPPGALEN